MSKISLEQFSDEVEIHLKQTRFRQIGTGVLLKNKSASPK